MKRLIVLLFCLVFFQILSAQIGKVGINTTSPSAMLHVKDSSVLFTGPVTLPVTPGNTPVSGAGTRMMWYPQKAAFRSGLVSGTQWDKLNIGQYSFSSGYNTTAKGDYSTSFGHTTHALGAQSTALGSSTHAIGTNTTSLGSGAIAKGSNSTAMGVSTQSNGYASTVIGQWNDTIVSAQTNMSIITPLFIIGKGDNATSRSNAFVVRKDGNVGIGISNPNFPLNFANTVGNKISLYGNSGAHFGFGIQASLLQIYTDNSIGDIAFGYGSSTSFTETMRIKGNGKIGIGTSTPAYPLNFGNTVGDKISLWGNDVFHYGLGIQAGLLQIHTSAPGEDIAFGHGNSTTLTETMRIKGNGTVGIGTNSPAYKLDVNGRMRIRHGADGTPGIWFNKSDNTAAISFIGLLNDEYIGLYGAQGSAWNFLMSTITGNVGIGLLAPASKLHVNGSGLFNGTMLAIKGSSGATAVANTVGQFENNTTAYLSLLTPDANESGLLFGNPTNSAHGGIVYNSSGSLNGLQFRTNLNTTRMVINNAGNVGIGTTSPGFPLNFSNSLGDKISLWGNSGAHYGIGLQSTLLQIHSDIIDSDIAFGYGSSTAFTETMRITGDGNLGIGTNAPSRILHVRKGPSSAIGATSTVGLFENNSSAYLNILTPNINESGLIFGNPASSTHGGLYYNSGATPNGLQFRTNLNIVRMVINNTGNVGIGTTSPDTKLHVRLGNSGAIPSSLGSALFENDEDSYINISAPANKSTGIWFNHASGTSTGAILYNQGTVTEGFRFQTNNNTVAMTINRYGWVGIGMSIQEHPLDVGGTARVGELLVTGDGQFDGVVLASCGVLSCSDIRYKKNISPLTNSLSSILLLDGVYYNWDIEKFPDKCFSDQRQIGIIAQEVEQFFPELVNTDNDGFKTVDYSRLTPVLLEAIKEQQAMINSQDEKINTQGELLKGQQEQIDFLMKKVIELEERSKP